MKTCVVFRGRQELANQALRALRRAGLDATVLDTPVPGGAALHRGGAKAPRIRIAVDPSQKAQALKVLQKWEDDSYVRTAPASNQLRRQLIIAAIAAVLTAIWRGITTRDPSFTILWAGVVFVAVLIAVSQFDNHKGRS